VQRYFIELAYRGTNFHGWQIQENALSVQEELEKSLSALLKEKIQTTGAGRTDTGVHANHFIAHFDSKNTGLHSDKNFVYKINRILHPDIAVKKIHRVRNDAHARFDAVSREYKYIISRIKDPFKHDICYEYFGELDLNLMNESSSVLMEYKDFGSFCKLHSDVKTTICNIYESKWEIFDNQLIYTICADRFLRNMVRAIVGTMFEVGRKKINMKKFREIIESSDRSKAGASAPAKALFLNRIEYPADLFII